MRKAGSDRGELEWEEELFIVSPGGSFYDVDIYLNETDPLQHFVQGGGGDHDLTHLF